MCSKVMSNTTEVLPSPPFLHRILTCQASSLSFPIHQTIHHDSLPPSSTTISANMPVILVDGNLIKVAWLVV